MKVLFLRASKSTDSNPVPHLGLAILAAILGNRGHKVMVVDYTLFNRRHKHAPPLSKIMGDFIPDVVGVSVYTATYYEALHLINEIRPFGCPIIVGGPHASLYHEEMSDLDCVDYIVKGEADELISDLVRNARVQAKPVVLEGKPANLDRVPDPDFSYFLNWKSINQYPLSTSRGCPFDCSFCSVKHISSKKWRKRDIGDCLNEVFHAKEMYPQLDSVKIVDDCPTLDVERFKSFLQKYTISQVGLHMTIDNMRADAIDDEMVMLAAGAGNRMICIGVEHGNEEVFNAIGKGEKLADIREAARRIKSSGLQLWACFVIGLPCDSLERTWDSINLARELKADQIYWNMAHPTKNTRIMDW